MSSKPSFGGLTGEYCAYEPSRFAVLPVPFELTCSWGRGAAMGPEAILEASCNMELYDIETDSEPYLAGIHTADPVVENSSAAMVESVYRRVSSFLDDGKYPIVLGGEHSVSIGSVHAFSEAFDGLSILHLDAHSDRRQEYEGDPLSHACAVARMSEHVGDVVSVGVRSMDSSELSFMDKKKVFFAHDIYSRRDWIPDVVAMLSDKVYVSIDLDVFDPSIMPSTGTPEPGGLDWYLVSDLLKWVVSEKEVVGFDVVELAPLEGFRAPNFLAAKLAYRMMSEVYSKK